MTRRLPTPKTKEPGKEPNPPPPPPSSSNPSAPTPAKSGHPAGGVEHVTEPHHDHFVVVGNHLAQHPELSLTAIGLAVHIQWLPARTPVGIKRLTAKFPEGEMRIAAALRELEAHGYLARTKERLLDREGGLREFDILGGRGFISFVAVPRHECVYICNVTWYG